MVAWALVAVLGSASLLLGVFWVLAERRNAELLELIDANVEAEQDVYARAIADRENG